MVLFISRLVERWFRWLSHLDGPQRDGGGAMVVNNCPLCMNKQRRIDGLEDEIKSLRAAMGREAQDG